MKRTPSLGIKIFDAPRRFLRGFLLTCIKDERNISFLRMNRHKIIMNNYSLVLIALFSIFLLPGCGTSTAESARSGLQNHELIVQRPEREPDMMGMVSNMVGNQVTILLFNEEDMPMNRAIRPDVDQSQQENTGERTSEFNPSQALGATNGTTMPRSGAGMGAGMRSGQGPDGQAIDRDALMAARNEMLKELKAKSIGSETITIPVGIPIVGGGRPGAETQIDFSSIQKDSMITVWLNEEIQDKKIADFVVMMGGAVGGNRIINGGAGAQN
jgi:hypothetical protein